MSERSTHNVVEESMSRFKLALDIRNEGVVELRDIFDHLSMIEVTGFTPESLLLTQSQCDALVGEVAQHEEPNLETIKKSGKVTRFYGLEFVVSE